MINSYLLAGLTRGLSLRLEDADPETRRSSHAREIEAESGEEPAPANRRRPADTCHSFPWTLSNRRWATR
jgi:hypothetical protein